MRTFLSNLLVSACCLPLWLGLPAVSVHAATNNTTGSLWFPVGETVHYELYWGIIPVAHSQASTEWVEEDGRQMLAIRFRTRSNAFLSKIYPVDDFLESIIDPETFVPIRFTKRLNEGRYHCDEVTEFDHEQGMAFWRSNESDERKEYAIEPDTRDLISFMYAMRRHAATAGATESYRVMADEKLYDLTVQNKEMQPVKLERYGKIDSMLMEPQASFQGLFVRSGSMVLWVAQDERRLMTQAEIDTPFANVHIKLDKVTGPGDDFWIVKGKEPKTKAKTRTRRRRR